MKTTENKDAYSMPDYERMTFETSDLIQQSGNPEPNDDVPIEIESPGAVNFFRP